MLGERWQGSTFQKSTTPQRETIYQQTEALN